MRKNATKRIEQIQKRLSCITSGPWKLREHPADKDLYFVEAPKENPKHGYDIEILGEDDTQYSTRRPDTEFIAKAPDDIKFLLALIEVMRIEGSEEYGASTEK